MAETRQEAIHRLEQLWHRLGILPEEEAKLEMEKFQVPTVLEHREMALIIRALIKHITPEQFRELLGDVLPTLKP